MLQQVSSWKETELEEGVHFLCSLVMIERHTAPSTFDDDGRAQAT